MSSREPFCSICFLTVDSEFGGYLPGHKVELADGSVATICEDCLLNADSEYHQCEVCNRWKHDALLANHPNIDGAVCLGPSPCFESAEERIALSWTNVGVYIDDFVAVRRF